MGFPVTHSHMLTTENKLWRYYLFIIITKNILLIHHVLRMNLNYQFVYGRQNLVYFQGNEQTSVTHYLIFSWNRDKYLKVMEDFTKLNNLASSSVSTLTFLLHSTMFNEKPFRVTLKSYSPLMISLQPRRIFWVIRNRYGLLISLQSLGSGWMGGKRGGSELLVMIGALSN